MMTTSQDALPCNEDQQSGPPRYLIGPDLYVDYIRLLRILLIVVVPIITVLVGMASGIAGADPAQVVLSGLGAGFAIGVQVSLWVTVAFAIIERTGARTRSGTAGAAVTHPVHSNANRVGLGETIGSIVGLALLIWVIAWQPGYQATFGDSAPAVPVVNPALSGAWAPIIICVLLASIVLAIVTYRVGHWTYRLAAANSVLSLAFAVPVIWLIATDELINPDFLAAISTDEFTWAANSIPTLIGWAVAAICTADIAGGWWKAHRSADDVPSIAGATGDSGS